MSKSFTKKFLISFFATLALLLFLSPILAKADGVWTEQTGSGARNWAGIASSADGTKLAAVVSNGYIYTSTDGGTTWTPQISAGARGWAAITSSADGTKFAAVNIPGYIYTGLFSYASLSIAHHPHKYQKITSISILNSLATTTIPLSTPLKLSASINPSNASDPVVVWSVTNGTGKATIIPYTGTLNPTQAGTITVTASSVDSSNASSTLNLTIINPTSTTTTVTFVPTTSTTTNTTPTTTTNLTATVALSTISPSTLKLLTYIFIIILVLAIGGVYYERRKKE